MKKLDKIIYAILIFLMIFPIAITRLITEYDLRVYSKIKIGTNIHDAAIQIKEANNKNHLLLNLFINRDSDDEKGLVLENDNFFLSKERNKMILSSGLIYEENLKNSYYVNNFFSNCYLVVSFDEKVVTGNSFSCEKDDFKDILK